MGEVLTKLMILLKEQKSTNEIINELKITRKQFYYYLLLLNNKGFLYDRKYCYNGEIIYIPKTSFSVEKEPTELILGNDNEIKMVVISDIHFGSHKENIKNLDIIYEYCAKEGIHIILNGGDLIDGTLGTKDKKVINPYDQVKYLIKNYPFDKNIINFTVLGNHDDSILKAIGLDLSVVLYNNRHDIVSLGYGRGELKIKEDQICLYHPLNNKNNIKFPERNAINLKGHSHGLLTTVFKTKKYCTINLPTISNLNTAESFLPSFIELKLSFNTNSINELIINQFIIIDKAIKISSQNLMLQSKNKFNDHTTYESLFNQEPNLNKSKKLILKRCEPQKYKINNK